ncbi:hypothetical protein MKX08_009664 [Trichoderma sp. CBMAI-0020]|nr:hypothetical protein MKX08_009664 [Trichoderma sp. CBMAI-0020]
MGGMALFTHSSPSHPPPKMHLPPTPTKAPLNIRQDLVLTQTIIRPSTTFVTTITFGATEPAATTSTVDVVPVPISHHDGLSGGQIGAILGSVVGVVALALIIGFCYVGKKKTAVAYEEEEKVKKRKRRNSHSTRSSTRGVYQYAEEDVYYYTAPRKKSSSKKASVSVQTPAPAVVSERIPGGPKFPSYRAIPISNPRNPQIRRTA